MSNPTYATQATLGVGLMLSHVMPQFAVGHRVIGKNNAEFMYGYAAAAVPLGNAVNFDESFNATLATTANTKRGMQMGMPLIAVPAGTFAWFQVRGVGTQGLQVAANTAANTKMNTTAVAGQLGTDATAGSVQVDGPILAVAQGGAAGLNLTANMNGFGAGASN